MESNTILRIVSSAAMSLIALIVFMLGDVAFYITILVIAVLSYSEWIKMTLQKSIILKVIGNIVILVPNSAMIYVYQSNGKVLLWMLLSVWANDIGAYVIGRFLGGPKLCTKISPNKTWAGLVSGIMCATVIGITFLYLSGLKNYLEYVVFTPFLPIVATAGDLFESGIKRICKVKDSGIIIPGHGGVLDRVDSFIFAAPFVAWLLFILK